MVNVVQTTLLTTPNSIEIVNSLKDVLSVRRGLPTWKSTAKTTVTRRTSTPNPDSYASFSSIMVRLRLPPPPPPMTGSSTKTAMAPTSSVLPRLPMLNQMQRRMPLRRKPAEMRREKEAGAKPNGQKDVIRNSKWMMCLRIFDLPSTMTCLNILLVKK